MYQIPKQKRSSSNSFLNPDGELLLSKNSPPNKGVRGIRDKRRSVNKAGRYIDDAEFDSAVMEGEWRGNPNSNGNMSGDKKATRSSVTNEVDPDQIDIVDIDFKQGGALNGNVSSASQSKTSSSSSNDAPLRLTSRGVKDSTHRKVDKRNNSKQNINERRKSVTKPGTTTNSASNNLELDTTLKVPHYPSNPIELILDLSCSNLPSVDSFVVTMIHTRVPKLQILDLRRNRIAALPPCLSQYLPCLVEIYLSENSFLELPTCCYHLPKLQVLAASKNRIGPTISHFGIQKLGNSLRELYLNVKN